MRVLNDTVHVKYLVECLAQNKYWINVSYYHYYDGASLNLKCYQNKWKGELPHIIL